jgi:thioredoxin 1
MSVIEITSINMINQLIDVCKSVDKFLIIKASASWCGPCKAIKPKYLQMAELYKNVAVFVEFDIEELEALAEQLSISSMPTFIVIKNGAVVKRSEGTDLSGILYLLDK